jgi:hypothetical protein
VPIEVKLEPTEQFTPSMISIFYMTAATMGVMAALLLTIVRLPKENERGIRYESAVRSAFVWAMLAACYYCHTRFGSVLTIDPAVPHGRIDLSPLLTIAIDFGIAAIGVRVTLQAASSHIPCWFECGITHWIAGLLTGVIGYWVLTSAQNDADERIRAIVHIAPERLPEAQRTLTLLLATTGWGSWLFFLYNVGAIIAFGSMANFSIFREKAHVSERISIITKSLLCLTPVGVFILYGPYVIPTISRDTHTTEAQFWTGMILRSSFIKHRPDDVPEMHGGVDDPHSVICLNLAPTARIAFVTPDDPVPAKVSCRR